MKTHTNTNDAYPPGSWYQKYVDITAEDVKTACKILSSYILSFKDADILQQVQSSWGISDHVPINAYNKYLNICKKTKIGIN